MICDVTELPEKSCAHCLSGEMVEPASSGTFTARYPGTCAGCGFDIKVGEQVRYGDERLRHAQALCSEKLG